LILLVIGFIAKMAILETIGIISPVIGAVLSILRWDARLAVLVARWRATVRIGPVGGAVSVRWPP
jgi:hypothetical protein